MRGRGVDTVTCDGDAAVLTSRQRADVAWEACVVQCLK
jgi:hypothetical protein